MIAAQGPAFSAGHDLKQLTARRSDADGGRAYFAEIMNACSAMMQAIVHLPKPVIAAVQGIATAAGCQLVASCDLAVASEAASFATPGVDIGLFCSTPMVALSRNVPRKQAMEMLLTGEPVPAERARDIGLINRVVPAGPERDAAIALAQKVARKSAYTVKLGKQAFYHQAEMNLAEAYRLRRRGHDREHDGARRRAKASAPSSKSASRNGRIDDAMPHPEEPRSGVSKDEGPECRASWFETRVPRSSTMRV